VPDDLDDEIFGNAGEIEQIDCCVAEIM